MIEMSVFLKKDLYLLLIDYEKAFDFANRAIMIKDMMEKGIGDVFLRAIAAMYRKSIYVPKVKDNLLGEMINTYHGVTQGRRSSTNFFSFLIHDLPATVHTTRYDDFMEPHNIAQMADDTILASQFRDSLKSKFKSVYNFSIEKKQSINIDKTLFIHMSKSPDLETLMFDDDNKNVMSLEIGKSIPYLGMHLYHTNSLKELIEFNLNKRMFNVAKFKSWLETNENTPFSIKMLVLDSCVLNAILYGYEAWGDLSSVSQRLQTIELDLLKSVLGVKKSTPNDLVYQEMNRGSITTKLMDRQKKFIDKIRNLDENEALVKDFWNRCKNLDIYKYYTSIFCNNYENDKLRRTRRITISEKSMDIRYRDTIGLHEKNRIYDADVTDSCRKIISRWRLSSFDLSIETGRHKRPIIERTDRICKTCLVMEDEEHVLFRCPLYDTIRINNPVFFRDQTSIKMILNPKSIDTIYSTANILFQIEKIHSKFNK